MSKQQSAIYKRAKFQVKWRNEKGEMMDSNPDYETEEEAEAFIERLRKNGLLGYRMWNE